MENHITPSRMANALMQDSSFNGHYVLVEGEQDLKLFKKFFSPSAAKLKVTHGKYKMREVYEILTARAFDRKIGIRDADFLRLKNNDRFDENYSLDIFPTDYHDAEGMVVNSQAPINFLETISNENKIKNFEESKGSIYTLVYNLSYPLACLRLANKVFRLGLSFKPKEKDGNTIKFKKFICEKKIEYLGDELMINTVLEYSKNRGAELSSREIILEKLEEIKKENHEIKEIVNGHDIAEILFIISKKGLNSQHRLLMNAACIEDMIFLSYSNLYFQETNLFGLIKQWEARTQYNITI